MIKNIVFDIGNVLVDFRLKEFLAEKGFDAPMIKRLLKASVMSPYWEQFERADITEQEAMDAFASLDPEIGPELHAAFADIHGMLTIRDYAVAWVKSLKEAGYQVFYFSNYSRKAYDECRDSLAFMEYMDGGFLSFQQRMTKPNPLLYTRFLEQFHLLAQESVFIDDTRQNVAVAESLGFHGIVFQSYADAVERLAVLGVEWLFFDVGSTLIDETECYNHRIRDAISGTDITFEQFNEKRMFFARQNLKGDLEALKFFGLKKTPWHKEDEKPYPETENILRTLVGKGYKIGVIANQSAGTEKRLEGWGLMKYISLVISSAEEGVAKPDREIFMRALRRAGCSAERAVMIGDRLDNDIEPANKLGMKTIWVKQGFAIYQKPVNDFQKANYVVDRLQEILKVL